MCGIAGLVGEAAQGADGARRLQAMLAAQDHRGPDGTGEWAAPDANVRLGHNRLAIIDLSEAGRQPMTRGPGRALLTFNGEIYNYLELRTQLAARFSFRTDSDSEVLLAAYDHWGEACLERLQGMFAFAIWDARRGVLFAARDRFGVKPFHYHTTPGSFLFASEIKALHAAGVPREPDPATWATYLARGLYDHGDATFWQGIHRLPPGHLLRCRPDGRYEVAPWYDLAERVAEVDTRSDAEVEAEAAALLDATIELRLHADVEIGVCLSGGLDSSLLLALLRRRLGHDLNLRSYTFFCGDPDYDETPWVEQLVEGSGLRARYCPLVAHEVPLLASAVAQAQDEPFGGIPTLGMAKVFAAAEADGLKVLLDGNGMDEAWAGYDYYQRAETLDLGQGPVQGTSAAGISLGASVLDPSFAALARPQPPHAQGIDPVATAQLRDLRQAKIPRALRFADRNSMACGVELREPFLDHRLVELGLRQPAARKLGDGVGKAPIRHIAHDLLPNGLRTAPKRPVQTPQREWLRGPLAPWADDLIETALSRHAVWLDTDAVRQAWRRYQEGHGDNSFPVWQWLSLALHD
jgi:asparagine synthase (glutamine-hydrolysing)